MITYTHEPDNKFTTTAKSGFPSPALDYLEERIDLNRELVEHPLSTVFVHYGGRAMSGAFIPPEAKLLVDKSLKPENGSIVVAVIDNRFIVRFLRKNQQKAWLVAADRKHPDIEITNRPDVTIWGVVKNIITDAKHLAKCML